MPPGGYAKGLEDCPLLDPAKVVALFPTEKDLKELASLRDAVKQAVASNNETAARWESLAQSKDAVIGVLSKVLGVSIPGV
jgi:hypothetical protein